MAETTFEIYVEDDRYAVPTLHLVDAADEAAARAVMDRLIRESAHHLGAELWLEGRALLRVGSYAVRPRARRDAGLGGLSTLGAAD